MRAKPRSVGTPWLKCWSIMVSELLTPVFAVARIRCLPPRMLHLDMGEPARGVIVWSTGLEVLGHPASRTYPECLPTHGVRHDPSPPSIYTVPRFGTVSFVAGGRSYGRPCRRKRTSFPLAFPYLDTKPHSRSCPRGRLPKPVVVTPKVSQEDDRFCEPARNRIS